jgi:hypothetical protein
LVAGSNPAGPNDLRQIENGRAAQDAADDAELVELTEDLYRVVKEWEKLPENIRKSILAIIATCEK